MSPLLWSVASAAFVALACVLTRGLGRAKRTRNAVLEEVRRRVRGGVIERQPGRGPQAHGRLGDLEVTVDLHHEPLRGEESPMWRVMAVGPVKVSEAIEVHVADWRGWIDPWMQMEKPLPVAGGVGPPFTAHAQHALTLDHPVIVAMRRQGPALAAGGLHVQPDFMRAEVRFDSRPENNQALFAFLDAMIEISGREPSRSIGSSRVLRVNFTREAG